MASRGQMVLILRGLIGDRQKWHNPLWYEDAELIDKLEFAVVRHDSTYSLDTLPASMTMMVCYRAAIDLCHELAAQSAPFAQFQIEQASYDKTVVMTNWLQLAERYREFYLLEIRGGLGSEGTFLVGELTRQSKTTGREVPYGQLKPFPPVVVTVKSQWALTVTLSWVPQRHYDFWGYKLLRRVSGTSDWTEIASISNQLTSQWTDTTPAPGVYDYRVDVLRGTTQEVTSTYPFNPSDFGYMTTEGTSITVSVQYVVPARVYRSSTRLV